MKYEDIHDFENLYQAHIKARRGKRFKSEVIEFEMSLFENLTNLSYELCAGIYRMDKYCPFKIRDPKERTIYAPSYRDRVVQHSLCDNVLLPCLDTRLIYDSAASRKGKGTHFAMNRLTQFLLEHYKQHGSDGFILKADIRKYFDNINHSILVGLLKETRCFDKSTMWLITQILNSYSTSYGKGLPLGNQCSQWFALFYLNPLDRLVKEILRIKYYTRYMDDCVLIHHDREYLKTCLEKMRNLITSDLKLNFNEKTQIVPMRQGVDYLGFHFYLTETGKVIRKLKSQNKRRIKRRLKHYKRAYKNGKIDFSAINRSVRGYNGHLSHGHTYRLKENIYRNFILKKPSASNYKEDEYNEN